MPVKRTLAAPDPVPPADLWRVPLRCRWTPAQVLQLAGEEPLPFTLTGAWAGGGTIVGADPLRVAGDGDDPFAILDEVPSVPGAPHSPGAVGGGWFGWLGYRLAARVEAIPLAACRPVALPDFHLAYYDNILRQDTQGQWWFEALVTEGRRPALTRRADRLGARLAGPAPAVAPPAPTPSPLTLSAGDAAHHLAAVRDCRRRIAAGEIFQANICLRLAGRYDGSAAALLTTALEEVAPPFGAAFDTPRGGIASLSPELFLRRRGRRLVTGPIKGTIARDHDPAIAAAALERLRGSAKDAAEHVMIVDLMRNDLGRVSEYGSVVAPRHPTAEAHPGLWHLVSHVRDGCGRASTTVMSCGRPSRRARSPVRPRSSRCG